VSSIDPLALPDDPVALQEALRLHLRRAELQAVRSAAVVGLAGLGGPLWLMLVVPDPPAELRHMALTGWALLATVTMGLVAVDWRLARRVHALVAKEAPPETR
jgi:hypothetical protein